MSTQTAPAPAAEVKASPAMTKAVATYVAAAGKLEVARDQMNSVAKSEAVRLSLDKKALTAFLFASGLNDARTVSETVGFVFPANAENRAALDKIIESNAKETDNKKRISKKVQLVIQRSKEPITVEAATALVTADKTRKANPPGGETTSVSTKPKTAKEQEDELKTGWSALASLAKKYGYDRTDYDVTYEEWCESFLNAILPDEEEEEKESK